MTIANNSSLPGSYITIKYQKTSRNLSFLSIFRRYYALFGVI